LGIAASASGDDSNDRAKLRLSRQRILLIMATLQKNFIHGLGRSMSTIETWIQQLQNSTSQAAAAEALAALGEEAQPAIVALVQHCGSADEAICNWCTSALEAAGPPAAEQIDELALLARSGNSDVAFWAVTLLGRAGSLAKAVEPILSERSADASAPEVQRRAAWALEQIRAA